MRALAIFSLHTSYFSKAIPIISDEDGPLHPRELAQPRWVPVVNANLTRPRGSPGQKAEVSWSKLFRSGIAEGIYVKVDACCYSIPANSPLGILASSGTRATNACACDPAIFKKGENVASFLQSSNAEIYRRAEAMTSDERAELQSTLKQKKNMWPDGLDSKGPKASKDNVPEPPQVSVADTVNKAIDRAKVKLAKSLNAPRDIKPYVYPLMIEKFSELLFLSGCTRDYTSRICPVGWSLKVDNQLIESEKAMKPEALLLQSQSMIISASCEPPVVYRGLCSVLNFTKLLDRHDKDVISQIRRLAKFCWFEYPCQTSPAYLWDLPCPLDFRLVSGEDEQGLCLRNRDRLGKCAPFAQADWSDVNDKVRYSIMCDEQWPTILTSKEGISERQQKVTDDATAREAIPNDLSGPVEPTGGTIVAFQKVKEFTS